MYEARRTSALGRSWTVTRDGSPLTEIEGYSWRGRGRFTLAGRGYRVTSTWTGGRYELRPDDGPGAGEDADPVARAERVGRKDWTITTADGVHEFRRGSWWRGDQQLVTGGHVLGYVRRTGRLGTRTEADLPGLPEVVAVFALTVVLLLWEQYTGAASG